MARSIQDIFASIQTARAADPILKDLLTSPSATALHRLWAYVTSVVLWAHEVLWDKHKAEVDAALARAKPGTATWYAEQALLFQEGDALVADDTGIHYPPGSTGPRIITRAVATENELTGKLFIKVARNGSTPGTLAALTDAQITQVRGYFDRKGFAGVRKEIVSREADRLKAVADIYYDPLIDLPTLREKVQTAVQSYLAALEFNGLLYEAKLQDAIQAVPGVKDIKVKELRARNGETSKLINRVYETEAGYIMLDEAKGSTFSETVKYLPHGSASY